MSQQSLSASQRKFKAVLFDLGGVVFDSPIEAIFAFATKSGMEPKVLNGLFAKSKAFAELERGEISQKQFYTSFAQETVAAGLQVDVESLMMSMTSTTIRPEMEAAIRTIRRHGLPVAAVTNNWRLDDLVSSASSTSLSATSSPSTEGWGFGMRELWAHGLFDQIIQSCVVGHRKPAKEIYFHATNLLGVKPEECIFLDDLGPNLKGAKALGMTTIKVKRGPKAYLEALQELQTLLDIPILNPKPAL